MIECPKLELSRVELNKGYQRTHLLDLGHMSIYIHVYTSLEIQLRPLSLMGALTRWLYPTERNDIVWSFLKRTTI
jgi:hypothetical protein